MTRQELSALGCMIPTQISGALNRYPHELAEGSQAKLWELVCCLTEENGRQHTYFDFYYGILASEEREKVRQALTKKQLHFLNSLSLSKDPAQLWFPYEARLFELAFTLSYHDILYSTFCFPRLYKTLWSSFGGQWLLLDYRRDAMRVLT